MPQLRPPLRIYIGYDEREEEAYRVCAWSLAHHASVPLDIRPLNVRELTDNGLYWRTWQRCPERGVKVDDLDGRPFSTDFAFTRFLVPTLAREDGHEGWALFVDCDFVFTADVAELFALADDCYGLMCVKHDHRPADGVKMDGQVQQAYPRKNWSSLMLWNCGSPAHDFLTGAVVSSMTGSWLHRFGWLDDDTIGAVPETWNHLSGYNQALEGELPKAIHFTSGGPWFTDPHYQSVPFAGVYLGYRDAMQADALIPEAA